MPTVKELFGGVKEATAEDLRRMTHRMVQYNSRNLKVGRSVGSQTMKDSSKNTPTQAQSQSSEATARPRRANRGVPKKSVKTGFTLAKENYYWLPHREVEELIYHVLDVYGVYTEFFIKSNTDGSYTMTTTADDSSLSAFGNDVDPDDFKIDPYTGSFNEVMKEILNTWNENVGNNTFFNVVYQAGDYEAVKSMVGDLVGGVDDEELMEIPLGKQFFERNTFYCPDPSKLDAECKKAMKKREKTKVESPSLYAFEDEIYDFRSEDEDS